MSDIFHRRRAVFNALWPDECYHKWVRDGDLNAEKCSYCRERRFATFGIPGITDIEGMGKILKRLRDFDKFVGVEFSPIRGDHTKTGAAIYWDIETSDELRLTSYKAVASTEAIALFEAVEKLIEKETLT